MCPMYLFCVLFCALFCNLTLFGVPHFVSFFVPYLVVVQICNKTDRHDTDCIQARDRAYTNCVCTVGVPASYRRAKG